MKPGTRSAHWNSDHHHNTEHENHARVFAHHTDSIANRAGRQSGTGTQHRTQLPTAAEAAVAPNRDADVCKRDELSARGKLNDEWSQFTPAQKTRCVSLTGLGGSPSYVELLTCLELAKAAKELPPGDRMTGQGSSN